MEKNKRIFALGFFDGVHLGHQALLRKSCELAAQMDCQSAALTFDTHPETLVRGQAPVLLNTPEDRLRLLRNFGVGPVYTLPFTRETMSMDWKDFIRLLLEYGAAGFVCGDDFRFGYRGEGNGEKLKQICSELGLPCAVIPEQLLKATRISSTHIRQLIENGEMATAVRFLGHPHILTGQVVRGHQLGRKLGVPTANLLLPEGLAVPKFGVYVCRAVVNGHSYPAVTNVGVRPTVSGRGITVESWILDYTGDLYDREIILEFHYFLRPEMKFPSLEALQAEIRKNAEETRQYLQQR
jgi:riboflavin kinase/FMN adenylyltransferase